MRDKNKNNKNINKLKNNKNYHPIFYKKFNELEKKIKKVKVDTVINCATYYSNKNDIKTIHGGVSIWLPPLYTSTYILVTCHTSAAVPVIVPVIIIIHACHSVVIILPCHSVCASYCNTCMS